MKSVRSAFVAIATCGAIACGNDDAGSGTRDGGTGGARQSDAGGAGHSGASASDAGTDGASATNGTLTLLGERCSRYANPPGASGPKCPDGVYPGDVDLTQESDLALLSGCTRIAGNLKIAASDATTLRALETLEVVEGDVTLSGTRCSRAGCTPGSALVSLDGADHVTCIGGNLSIVGQMPLDDVTGFPKLVEVQGSLAVQTEGTKPTHGAIPVLRVWGDVDVPALSMVPAIVNVYGSVFDPATSGAPRATLAASALPNVYVGCAAGSSPCRDGILGCDFTAKSDAEVASLSSCQLAIQGLTVSGADVRDVSPLAQLQKVRGTFGVRSTRLTRLDGLEALASAEALYLDGNSGLTDVSGLHTVRLHSLVLSNDSALTNTDGWDPRLDEDGTIDIRDCPALQSFGMPNLGSVSGVQIMNAGLTTLEGLSALTHVGGLVLLQLPVLDALNGLAHLTSADGIQLSSVPVKSLAGLSALTSLGSLTLQDTLLSDLRGLSNVTSLATLDIEDSTSLVNLAGLDGLTSLGKLTLTRLSNLASIDALSHAAGLELLSLSDLPALTSLGPLAKAAPSRNVYVDGTGLTDLRGLEGVTRLPDGLVLTGNPALATLDGLGSLVSVGTNLDIQSNLTLESLHGLSSLGSAESVDVQGNTRLSTCEVDWLLGRVGQSGAGATWTNGGDRNCHGGTAPALPASVVWFRHYDIATEQFSDVALLGDGSFVVEGQNHYDDSGDYRELVQKLSPSGDVLWKRRIDGPASTIPEITQTNECLEVAPDQTIVTMVDELGSTSSNATYTFSADGTAGPVVRDQTDQAEYHHCVVTASGSLYYGFDSPVSGGAPAELRKRTQGNTEWTVSLDAEIANEGQSVAQVLDTPPGVTVVSGLASGTTTRLTHLNPDGTVTWRRDLTLPTPMDASVGDGGRYLLSGQTDHAIDAGSGNIALPASGKTYAYLLWLGPEGSYDSVHFVDGEGWVPPRTALGAGDIIYFMIGVPKRPFSFEPSSAPGSLAPGITFAKLDRDGQLLSAIDVTANVLPWTVDGSVGLSTAQPVVGADGVIVVGSLLSGAVAFKFGK